MVPPFGYSVSEFVAFGKFAFEWYEACNNSVETFQELAQQCLSIYIAVGQTIRALPNHNTQDSDDEPRAKLSAITDGCRPTLGRLKRLMERYKSLGTPSPTAWDTMTFALRLIIKNDLGEIRSQLTFHLVALNVFMAGLQGNTLGTILQRLDTIACVPSVSASDVSTAGDGRLPPSSTRADPASLEDDDGRSGDLALPIDSSGRPPYTEEALNKAMEMKQKRLQDILNRTPDLLAFTSLLTSARQATLPILEPSFRYSKHDQRLSLLPEGWQRTLINEHSYHYRYLFSSKTICSRPYRLKGPFEVCLDVELSALPPGWTESKTLSRGSYYFRPLDGKVQFTRPSMIVPSMSDKHYIGWITADEVPIDLDDICSLELVRAMYIDRDVPWEDIGIVLSQTKAFKGWQCASDGFEKPVYSNATLGAISGTVHPAFFLAELSAGRKDGCAKLPPGWDRRLDTWGSLFYVDHNTGTARRTHPCDDPTISLDSGLPKGWESIKDQDEVTYFFLTDTLLATYDGISMRDSTNGRKFALQYRPKPGEIPPIKEDEIWKRTSVLSVTEDSDLRSILEDPYIIQLYEPDSINRSHP